MTHRYDIVQRLGAGTYGVVYKAKDRRTGNYYAMKKFTLDPHTINTTTLREIAFLTSLPPHPNIVQIHDIIWWSTKLYMFESLGSYNLITLVERAKTSDITKLSFVLDLVKALTFLQMNGVLHRDIKPENIIYFQDENIIKLADFGLARSEAWTDTKYLTGNIITLWYRPPELLLGGKIYGYSADLWSFGCTLYYLFTSQHLFTGDSEIHTLYLMAQKLGDIDLADWPDAVNYPRFSIVKNFQRPRMDFHLPYGLDKMLNEIFVYNPVKRTNVYKILENFQQYVPEESRESFEIPSTYQILSAEEKLSRIQHYPPRPLDSTHRDSSFEYILSLDETDNVKALTFYILDSVGIYSEINVKAGFKIADGFLFAVPGNLFEDELLIDAERAILTNLDFKIRVSTAIDFAEFYLMSYSDKISKDVKDLVMTTYLRGLSFEYSGQELALGCIFVICQRFNIEYKHRRVNMDIIEKLLD